MNNLRTSPFRKRTSQNVKIRADEIWTWEKNIYNQFRDLLDPLKYQKKLSPKSFQALRKSYVVIIR